MRYLALGDSYTIGELVEEQDNFPNQLTELLKKSEFPNLEKPVIIAKTGWTSEELFQAFQAESLNHNFDFVTLLIGVNDQYRGIGIAQYQQYFLKLLTRAILLARGQSRRVFVLSIPDWGVTPFARAKGKLPNDVAAEIGDFNKKNKILSQAYRCHYLDITPDSRRQGQDEQFLAPDKLHYSAAAYRDWSQQAAQLISKTLKSLN